MVFRICLQCGAHLDPGERCDCLDKKEAAHDATNIASGQVEKGLPTNISISEYKVN